ncbi:MAG: Gfo/Idh/MocA family oxidoreductase [Geminicoccaceae bacterium]
MAEIGVGIIGTGFMGECHALAFTAVAPLFQPKLRPRLAVVADVNAPAAERARDRFGFARATGDWRSLVSDPAVEIVSITAPNILHKEMALAAIAAGKHVYCEKPLALTAADARELTLAAEAAGVRTMVGYNYLCSPAIRHVKKLLDEGELGTLTYLRCAFEEDYMADPAVPFSWRCERAKAGSGALGDLGSHAISLARFLGGPITEVLGETAMVVPERAVAPPGGDLQFARIDQPSEMRKVENEDIAHCLFRFASGVIGSMVTSRTAWGRKNGPDFELYGTLAGVRYRQERFNEFELFRSGARKDDNGYRIVYCGPYHGEYGKFTPAPGHGIGFNDLKVIEVAGLLEAIATDRPLKPDFREGWAIEAVCDAVLESAERRAWVAVDQAA